MVALEEAMLYSLLGSYSAECSQPQLLRCTIQKAFGSAKGLTLRGKELLSFPIEINWSSAVDCTEIRNFINSFSSLPLRSYVI